MKLALLVFDWQIDPIDHRARELLRETHTFIPVYQVWLRNDHVTAEIKAVLR